MRERGELRRLRGDLARAEFVVLCFDDVDLWGATAGMDPSWAGASASERGSGSVSVWFERHWPERRERWKLYFDFEASEWAAAAGVWPPGFIWLGKVPTSQESYL